MQTISPDLQEWRRALEGYPPESILAWAWQTFPGRVAFASSLGAEDQVLTDMIVKTGADLPIFMLDTGRLFAETHDLLRETEAFYGIRIRVYAPEAAEVENLVQKHGINLFRESVELRKKCCEVRKIGPLRRALTGLDAWVCGLRREQSPTRQDAEVIEWDEGNGLARINPLLHFTESEIWEYIRENNVPFNPLHEAGFKSIGCACCTRAVKPGEDVRAGRWWWESPEHKECGLHGRKKG